MKNIRIYISHFSFSATNCVELDDNLASKAANAANAVCKTCADGFDLQDGSTASDAPTCGK